MFQANSSSVGYSLAKMSTLLDFLTKRNAGVNSKAVVTRCNVTTVTDIMPDDWSPWVDFNYAILTRISRKELDSQYQGSPEQRALPYDLMINNEKTLEDFLPWFISLVVNYALESQDGNPHPGQGSRCRGEDRPDWSVILFCG